MQSVLALGDPLKVCDVGAGQMPAANAGGANQRRLVSLPQFRFYVGSRIDGAWKPVYALIKYILKEGPHAQSGCR
jgi:hypothetical protein